jgi:hypothetical protein
MDRIRNDFDLQTEASRLTGTARAVYEYMRQQVEEAIDAQGRYAAENDKLEDRVAELEELTAAQDIELDRLRLLEHDEAADA